MQPHDDGPSTTRREFLAQTGAVAAVALSGGSSLDAEEPAAPFEPVKIPDWVHGVTRMAFVTPGDVGRAAKAGAQVVHTNVVWPYFPLRRDGGGLSEGDARRLRDLVADCRRGGVRCCLGLPPFPPAALVKRHPDWRVHPDDSDAAEKQAPSDDDLGTRVCCNNGPWGDYLIDVCAELIADYGLDGFSFDGNYHPPLCFCPACKIAYKQDRKRDLPAKIDLDDTAYREYLVWRGERLEDHYRRMQQAIKKANADAVLTSWTVNAGRYGHFLLFAAGHADAAEPAVRPADAGVVAGRDEHRRQPGPVVRRRLPQGDDRRPAVRLRAVPDVARQPLRHGQLPRPRTADARAAVADLRRRAGACRSAGPATRAASPTTSARCKGAKSA